MVFISVSVEQLVAEVKNYYQVVPAELNFGLLQFWLAGRIQEAVVAGGALMYLVFGRNGKKVERTEPPK